MDVTLPGQSPALGRLVTVVDRAGLARPVLLLGSHEHRGPRLAVRHGCRRRPPAQAAPGAAGAGSCTGSARGPSSTSGGGVTSDWTAVVFSCRP